MVEQQNASDSPIDCAAKDTGEKILFDQISGRVWNQLRESQPELDLPHDMPEMQQLLTMPEVCVAIKQMYDQLVREGAILHADSKETPCKQSANKVAERFAIKARRMQLVRELLPEAAATELIQIKGMDTAMNTIKELERLCAMAPGMKERLAKVFADHPNQQEMVGYFITLFEGNTFEGLGERRLLRDDSPETIEREWKVGEFTKKLGRDFSKGNDGGVTTPSDYARFEYTVNAYRTSLESGGNGEKTIFGVDQLLPVLETFGFDVNKLTTHGKMALRDQAFVFGAPQEKPRLPVGVGGRELIRAASRYGEVERTVTFEYVPAWGVLGAPMVPAETRREVHSSYPQAEFIQQMYSLPESVVRLFGEKVIECDLRNHQVRALLIERAQGSNYLTIAPELFLCIMISHTAIEYASIMLSMVGKMDLTSQMWLRSTLEEDGQIKDAIFRLSDRQWEEVADIVRKAILNEERAMRIRQVVRSHLGLSKSLDATADQLRENGLI